MFENSSDGFSSSEGSTSLRKKNKNSRERLKKQKDEATSELLLHPEEYYKIVVSLDIYKEIELLSAFVHNVTYITKSYSNLMKQVPYSRSKHLIKKIKLRIKNGGLAENYYIKKDVKILLPTHIVPILGEVVDRETNTASYCVGAGYDLDLYDQKKIAEVLSESRYGFDPCDIVKLTKGEILTEILTSTDFDIARYSRVDEALPDELTQVILATAGDRPLSRAAKVGETLQLCIKNDSFEVSRLISAIHSVTRNTSKLYADRVKGFKMLLKTNLNGQNVSGDQIKIKVLKTLGITLTNSAKLIDEADENSSAFLPLKTLDDIHDFITATGEGDRVLIDVSKIIPYKVNRQSKAVKLSKILTKLLSRLVKKTNYIYLIWDFTKTQLQMEVPMRMGELNFFRVGSPEAFFRVATKNQVRRGVVEFAEAELPLEYSKRMKRLVPKNLFSMEFLESFKKLMMYRMAYLLKFLENSDPAYNFATIKLWSTLSVTMKYTIPNELSIKMDEDCEDSMGEFSESDEEFVDREEEPVSAKEEDSLEGSENPESEDDSEEYLSASSSY